MNDNRIKVSQQPQATYIKIPIVKNLYVIIPLAIFSVLWFFGLVVIIKLIYTSFRWWIELGVGMFAISWLAGGYALFSTLFWMLFGSEHIIISKTHLKTSKPLIFYRRINSYPIKDISNIRVDKELYQKKENGVWMEQDRTVIKMKTPYKIIVCARGVSEREAEYILLQISLCPFIKEDQLSEHHLY
jgi:hypothetical protein